MRYLILLTLTVLAVLLGRVGFDLVASGKLKKTPALNDFASDARTKNAANFNNASGIRPNQTKGLGGSLREPSYK